VRNHRNRYYSPSLGRWTATDPIGFKGGLNLYAYANNTATNATDPYGLLIEISHYHSWDNLWTKAENWVRDYFNISGDVAAGQHYIRLFGDSEDGCTWSVSPQYDSAIGQWTFSSTPLVGISPTIQGPTASQKRATNGKCCDNQKKVECATITSSASPLLGFSAFGQDFGFYLGSSSITLQICADGATSIVDQRHN
jgi:uncharacterized protein RhaS with RHS repeats